MTSVLALKLRRVTAVSLLVGSLVAVDLSSSAGAATSTVSGTVFLDMNSDGSKGTGETGVSGVTVRAFDSAGTAVGTATSGSDGTYSLAVTGAATSSVRVEFDTPAGHQSSFAPSTGGTSIQFVTMPATSVDFALIVPGNYCADNNADPVVATNCQTPGKAASTAANSNAGTKSAIAYTTWSGRAAFTKVVENQYVGATWGLASQPSTGLVWASAFLRRHSAFGPKGIGGLYVAHPLTGLVTSFDLAQYMTLSADNTQFTDAARGFQDDINLSLDSQSFGGVGKVGIGDIEFSADGTRLYVMNLYERKLYTFPVSGTTAAPVLGTPTSVAVTDPGCTNAADSRPFGLKVVADGILVGVVCSNETANATSFSGTRRPGSGYIRKISDAGTWSTVATINFGYERAVEEGNCKVVADLTNANAPKCEAGRWKAWTDDFAAIKAAVASTSIWKDGNKYYFSQPIIMGIDMLEDGSIIAGVSDRLSRQLGAVNLDPTDTGVSAGNPGGNNPWVTAFTRGDTILLCNTGTTSSPVYAQESDGTCGSRTSTGGSRAGAGVNATSPYREFFKDQIDEGDIPAAHQENSQGAVAVWPPSGTQEIAVTAMDPGWNYYSGGIRWYKSSDGTFSTNATNVYFRDLQSEWPSANPLGGSEYYKSSFGKSSGMGDIEVLCNMAPVQIGNRVWIDTDKDGIQDPDESAVSGVTVRLYAADGTTLLGTAVTNSKGEYYFSSNNTEAAAGTGDHMGGGLVVGAAHVIRFDNPADYASGGPLYQYQLTSATAAAPGTSLDTSIDSNASTVSSYPQITTSPVLPGVNDHTYDVGFFKPPTEPTYVVGMGNYVWIDADKDGIQDTNEKPIKGVVVTLYNPDGTAAKNNAGTAATATTDANGYYFIDNLTPGSYYAKFTLPAAYQFTTRSSTGSTGANDSNPDTTTGITPVFTIGSSASGDTVADTDSATTATFVNPTIDAGVVPKGTVSVGNLVWHDRNGDGIQGKRDGGVKGAILRLFNTDGTPVTDAFGRAVKAQRTGSDGKFLFANLLPGKYVVKITYPKGWLATTNERSGRDKNSSAFRSESKTLAAGQSDMSLDFGMVYRSVKLLPATR